MHCLCQENVKRGTQCLGTSVECLKEEHFSGLDVEKPSLTVSCPHSFVLFVFQKQVWHVEEKINMSKREETWKKGKETEKRRRWVGGRERFHTPFVGGAGSLRYTQVQSGHLESSGITRWGKRIGRPCFSYHVKDLYATRLSWERERFLILKSRS